MNNLTKAIEEAMMDLSRWEYVNHALIEIPLNTTSMGLKDKVTGIVFELVDNSLLYRGESLNIDKWKVNDFINNKFKYNRKTTLSNLYKAYNVEE